MSTPLSRTCALALIAVAWLASGVPASAAQEAPASPEEMLRDKTLVVWAAPANLDQRGGSALSIDNGDGSFDAVVFGELEPKRWMPGSNGFVRTEKNQAAWPAETARPDEFVQMAIVYRGREIAVYRNGKEYARYAMAESPQSFSTQAVAVFGRRHLDTRDPERSFAGRIRDARIYARPLDVPTLASLKPGEASAGLEPWAWWSFADEGLREKTGRFNQIKFIGDVRIEKGCLVLPGKGASVFAASAPRAARRAPRLGADSAGVVDHRSRARRSGALDAALARAPAGRPLSTCLPFLPARGYGNPRRSQRRLLPQRPLSPHVSLQPQRLRFLLGPRLQHRPRALAAPSRRDRPGWRRRGLLQRRRFRRRRRHGLSLLLDALGRQGNRFGAEQRSPLRSLDQARRQSRDPLHRIRPYRGQGSRRQEPLLRLGRSFEHLEEARALLYADRQSAPAQQDRGGARTHPRTSKATGSTSSPPTT